MGTLEEKQRGECPPSPHGEWAEEAQGDDPRVRGHQCMVDTRTGLMIFHHPWAFLTHPFSAHFSSSMSSSLKTFHSNRNKELTSFTLL